MKKLLLHFILLFCIVNTWAQTFTGTGGGIPANSTGPGITPTCFSQTISGVGTINSTYGLASVCININHAFDEELEIFLTAPDGTRVPLSIQNGLDGNNYTNTCFSSTATIAIKNGAPPYTGTFRPEGYLGQVNNGQNANGTWSLCVQDRRGGTAGTVVNWSATFNNTPAPPPPIKPPCTVNLVSGTSCATAPTICDFNGVCGKTQGVRQVWANSGLEDCFGIQNNTFIKFVASASTATFAVWVTATNQTGNNIINGGGIQMIFFSGTCGSGAITSYGCYSHLQPFTLSEITAAGLTSGQTYYLMFDGFNSDVSDFSIAAQSGVNILDVDPESPSFCTGGSVNLTASGGNGVYAWSPAAGLSATSGVTVTATPATTTTYTVTSSGVGSCPISKDVLVTVNALPVITAQPSTTGQTVCQNGAVAALTVTATAGSGTISTYQWYSNTTASTTGGTLIVGATSATYTPSSASLGTLYYYTIITNSNSCSRTSNISGPIIVTSSGATPVTSFTYNTPVCNTATVNPLPILASGFTTGGVFSSSPSGLLINSSTGEIGMFGSNQGNYTVTYTVAASGCTGAGSSSTPFGITTITTPSLSVVNNCGSSTVTASGFTGTLTWSDGGTGNPRNFTAAGGPYTVTQTNGGCTSPSSNAVSVAPLITPPPTLAVVNNCGSSTITATGITGTLTWSDGGTGNPRNFIVAGGPYTATQTINGCASVASNAVSVAPGSTPAPTLAVVNNCGSSTVTASGFTGTLTWSDGGTGNPRNFTVAGGPYTVTQTISGCASVASNAVSVAPASAPAPTLAVVNNCGSSTVTASGFTGTLSWSDGGTGNPRTFTNANGPITVTQTIGNCTSAASNAVSTAPLITPPPTLAVANNCGSSTITASGFTGTLTWSDGGTGNPRNFTIAGGPYTVTQTINSCASTASNAVNAAPVSASAPVLTVVNSCGTSTITASGVTGTLTWSDGGTGNPRIFTVAGGPFTATQIVGSCTSPISNAVSANPSSANAPVLTVTDDCGTSTLTASGFTGTLTWSDGGTGNPRNFTVAGGPYTVTQTISGCTSSASNAVSVNPSSINAPILTVVDNCGSSTITASGFTGTLTWSDGGTGNPRTFTTASGPYIVTQTIGACTSLASNAVSVAPIFASAPVLTVADNCGNSVITASGFTGTLTWSDGGTGNPRTFTAVGGPYTVTQTIGTCVSPSSNAVSVAPIAVNAPTLTVQNNCGNSVITASGFTGTLNWNDGGSGNTRTFTTAGGPYVVTQTIGACTSIASNAALAAPLLSPAPILAVQNNCGSSVVTASGFTGTLTWSDGGTGNPRTFTTNGGPYTVTQTIGTCTSLASNAVSVAPLFTAAPVLSVQNNCGNAIISASGVTGTLAWSDGGNGNPRTFTVSGGPYTVTQSVSGCASIASNSVSVAPLAIPSAPILTVVNTCNSSTITATGFTGTLTWSDGASGNPRVFNANGGPYTATQTIGTCTSALSNPAFAQLVKGGVIPLLGNNAVLCPGEQLVLDPGVYAQYLWQDNSVSRRFTVNQTGVYSVKVTDAEGCSFTDAVSIQVLTNCSEVYFPSAFSPNGDGTNETFGALGNLRDITAYTLSVFDRYGNIVFTTSDPFKKWDGRYLGTKANMNNYVWMATYIYKATEKRTQKGNLILVR